MIEDFPRSSRIHKVYNPRDFVDYYPLEPQSTASLRDIAQELVSNQPKWFMVLFALRNRIAMLFGLVHDIEPEGDYIGFFPVISEHPDELIMGLDDKHLDFKIYVIRDQKQMGFGTWVRTHNLGGRFYLTAIMPFHKLICRHWQKAYRETNLA